MKSDTWVATDALGRKTPPASQCPIRPGKMVGIFYFLWHGFHTTEGPYDITKIIAKDPEDPPYGPRHVFHWWGEPEAGYYMAQDTWVIRRNLSMIADAGIDTLIFDVTNAFTYKDTYLRVCRIATEMRSHGERTPQVMFITWAHSPQTVKALYDDFYSKGLFKDLWFRWQGKPLILGKPDDSLDDGSPLPQNIRDFFTWREAWFQPAGYQAGYHEWTWGSTLPLDYAWDRPGVPEEVSVSVATHPTGNIGRSFHNGKEPPHDRYKKTPETPNGYFFSEQWRQAMKIDPAFVFVTGWNEWVAQRFIVGGPGVPDADSPMPQFLGDPTVPGKSSFFVDQYNEEYSRDIEPMKGGHTDDYYYQLVDFVRRFKGAHPPEKPGRPKAIRIAGPFSQWDDVTPEYRDTVEDTLHRDFRGWGTLHYRNATGRNDFVRLKVARDTRFVTFYAQTRAKITPRTGHNWMLLFIDADQDSSTGWNGYDYAVGLGGAGLKTTPVRRNAGGWKWAKAGDVPYRVEGNQLMVRIPRAMIGQAGKVAFDFHWADNICDSGDITEFALNGDSAPNRRFNYRYGERRPAE